MKYGYGSGGATKLRTLDIRNKKQPSKDGSSESDKSEETGS